MIDPVELYEPGDVDEVGDYMIPTEARVILDAAIETLKQLSIQLEEFKPGEGSSNYKLIEKAGDVVDGYERLMHSRAAEIAGRRS